MKWYTRKGDEGLTSLPTSNNIWKDDIIIEAIGDLDELNSVLGILSSLFPQLENTIESIQADIFTISAEIVGFNLEFNEEKVKFLEEKIEEFSKHIPQLTNFVIPGGHIAAAFTQFARAVCRRAERRVVSLYKLNKSKKAHVMYLNRLSSLLFVISLWINKVTNNPERIWKAKK